MDPSVANVDAREAQGLAPVRRALISVSDKTGLVERAERLSAAGVALISTGGTHGLLRDAGLDVQDVASLTAFPEMLDGRVKTLHPLVHGGLLAKRDDAAHLAALADQGGEPIDLLVVNLYPFEATRASGASFDAIVEQIDIGGPAMLRAAAKNHAHVAVCVDLEALDEVLDAMATFDGATPLALRKQLAAKTFARTAAYDAGIASWLGEATGELYGGHAAVGGQRTQALRYGENPHLAAALYVTGDDRPGAATAELIQGKPLSYNNIQDADAAFELACEFEAERSAVTIVKHANPCGVAIGSNLADAYGRALACDPVSAFGGVIAANQKLDAAAAEAITAIFTEVVIAPDADDAAKAVFAAKPNLRLLLTGALADPSAPGRTIRSVAGGFLLQDRDAGRAGAAQFKIVTDRTPSAGELRDMAFAWRVAKHVKSNAIVYAKDEATAGVGAGQMSRVDAARIAAHKARDAAAAAGWDAPMTQGSACASDAFFPFADGLLQAVEAGATAVVQPGGSVRDAEVVEAANQAGIAMAFTGMRHFRH